MLPSFPNTFLPRPFADNGTWQLIPDAKTAPGRASYREGFPTETQQPLSAGGVAPSRVDFNGILHMLSTLAFWQQSGGLWVYRTTIDYNTPAMVFHNGELWYCKAANGPGTTVPGAVTPGTNEDYWVGLLEFLALAQSGGKSSAFSSPVGTIIMYAATTPPEGYFACNGSSFSATQYPELYAVLGKAQVPDMRGLFVRGYDTRNTVDPDGQTRTLLSKQGDAMRNLTGSFYVDRYGTPSSGVFADGGISGGKSGSGRGNGHLVSLDASRQVATATENRPKNICVLYCIKHD
jgi:hypothetical protein